MATILTFLLIVSCLPSSIIVNATCIQNSYGTITGYKEGKNSTGYDYLYLGKKEEKSIKWRVLSDKGNATNINSSLSNSEGNHVDNSCALFLLTDDVVALIQKPDQAEKLQSDSFQTSLLKAWCQSVMDDGDSISFHKNEKDALLCTNKDDYSIEILQGNTLLTVEKELNGEKLFLLSGEELINEEYGFNPSSMEPDDARMAKYNGEYIEWIIRQPVDVPEAFRSFIGAYVTEGAIGAPMILDESGLRPAANLYKDAILFSSAAEGGKGDFSKVEENTTHEWKLTLKDDNTFADGTIISTTTCAPGKDITIIHKKLSEISADYTDITAAISDQDGNLLYYGSLGTDVNATETKLTIPADLQDGTYKLAVYGEDWNGDKFTDYATGTPFKTELTVDSKAGDDTPAPTPTPAPATKVGTVVTVGNLKYKITSVKANNSTVTITGIKNKKKTSVKIPAAINSRNVSYKVTAIDNNAFKGNKKLKSVTIGKNVISIGKNAFKGCKNLKRITVSTKVLKKVGAGCLKGIHKKAVIKVPAKNKKAYKKLFKKKGQAKTVKIK